MVALTRLGQPDRIQLLKEIPLDDTQSLFRHDREICSVNGLVESKLARNHVFHIPAKSIGIAADDSYNAMNFFAMCSVDSHVREAGSVLLDLTKVFIQPYYKIALNRCLCELVETTQRVPESLPARNHGMHEHMSPPARQEFQSLVFEEVVPVE